MIIAHDQENTIRFDISNHEIGKDYEDVHATEEGLIYQEHGERLEDAAEVTFNKTNDPYLNNLSTDSWKTDAIISFYYTFKKLGYEVKRIYFYTTQRSEATRSDIVEDYVLWVMSEKEYVEGGYYLDRDEKGKWVFNTRHNCLVNPATIEIFKHGEADSRNEVIEQFVRWYEGDQKSFNIIDAVRYVLFDAGLSNYRIYKETGIYQSTLGKYTRGETKIEDMSLGIAAKLYKFYLKMKNKGLDVRLLVKVNVVEMKENFPNHDEAYAVLTDGSRYAFAWGHEFPFADELPRYGTEDGESGFEWYDTKEEALSAMKTAIEAWDTK